MLTHTPPYWLSGILCAGLTFASALPVAAGRAPGQPRRSAGRKSMFMVERPRRNETDPSDLLPPDPQENSTGVYRSRSAARTSEAAGDSASTDPSVGPDRSAVRDGSRRFQQSVRERRVQLLNSSREAIQLDGLSADGLYHWPALQARTIRPNAGDLPGDRLDGGPAAAAPLPRSGPAPMGSGKQFAPPTHPAAPRQFDGQDPADDPAVSNPVDSVPAPINDTFLNRISGDPVTVPPVALFLMLNRLADASTVRKPLEISSLLRPPYHTAAFPQAGPGNPHSLGLAADITAFGGHRIHSEDPEECVLAFVALLRALPVGRYRMGVPRAPAAAAPTFPADDSAFSYAETYPPDPGRPRTEVSRSAPDRTSRHFRRPTLSPSYGKYAAARPGSGFDDPRQLEQPVAPPPADTVWPFFPPPQQVADLNGNITTKYLNERYAPMAELNDGRVRDALAQARSRGVNVVAMFPDGANHIHLDVKQIP